MDVLPNRPGSAAGPASRPPPRPSRGGGGGVLRAVRDSQVVLAVVGAIVLGMVALALLGAARRPPSGPPVPADAATAPLATPPAAPAGEGGYAFMAVEDDGSGRPVRWDPCRPIHYVVRPDGAPPGGQALLEQAVARISALTGLVFVADGTTDEAPTAERPAMDRSRYGDRWSPVLVAWTDPVEYPEIKGAAGRGGPLPVDGSRPGERHYVSGVVFLNGDNLRDVANWNAGRAKIRGVIEHEFGHLVGLAHSTDPSQLMFDRQTVLAGERLGDGDRRGLAALGGGPCFTTGS